MESAGAMTMACTCCAIICSTISTCRERSNSSLVPLAMSSYSAACACWCAVAPSCIVLKNSLASDFMTSAMRGFAGCGAVLQLASKRVAKARQPIFKNRGGFMTLNQGRRMFSSLARMRTKLPVSMARDTWPSGMA